jgi:hypothetical protein
MTGPTLAAIRDDLAHDAELAREAVAAGSRTLRVSVSEHAQLQFKLVSLRDRLARRAAALAVAVAELEESAALGGAGLFRPALPPSPPSAKETTTMPTHPSRAEPDLQDVYGCIATALEVDPYMSRTTRELLEAALRLLGPDAVPRTLDMPRGVWVSLDDPADEA